MNRDEATLLDILQAARLIQQFTADCPDERAFREDVKLQSAVLHQITILGEATKRLFDAFLEAHPAIPWRQMASMRDVLIHGYDDIDLGEVR
jgi:uncharacterized protein with HEPN domain